MSWLCPHTDKKHYAHGKCLNCYLSEYNLVRFVSCRSKDTRRMTAIRSLPTSLKEVLLSALTSIMGNSSRKNDVSI